MSDSKYSLYITNAFQNWIWQAATLPTVPSTLYLALFTVGPLRDGSGGAEASNYSRLAFTRGTGVFATAAGTSSGNYGIISNTAIVAFPAAASGGISGGSNITAVGVYDASSGGNLIATGVVGTAQGYPQGAIPIFNPGDLSFAIDSAVE